MMEEGELKKDRGIESQVVAEKCLVKKNGVAKVGGDCGKERGCGGVEKIVISDSSEVVGRSSTQKRGGSQSRVLGLYQSASKLDIIYDEDSDVSQYLTPQLVDDIENYVITRKESVRLEKMVIDSPHYTEEQKLQIISKNKKLHQNIVKNSDSYFELEEQKRMLITRKRFPSRGEAVVQRKKKRNFGLLASHEIKETPEVMKITHPVTNEDIEVTKKQKEELIQEMLLEARNQIVVPKLEYHAKLKRADKSFREKLENFRKDKNVELLDITRRSEEYKCPCMAIFFYVLWFSCSIWCASICFGFKKQGFWCQENWKCIFSILFVLVLLLCVAGVVVFLSFLFLW